MSSPGAATSSAGIPTEFGVPVWSGDPLKLDEYETAALWFRSALKPSERSMAAARLWGALRGPARDAVKDLKPSEFEAQDGVERLLAKLKSTPLSRMPIPDAYNKIKRYDTTFRKGGETITEFIIREDNTFKEMVAALRRLRDDRRGRRQLPAGEGLEELDGEASRTETEGDLGFFESELRGYRILQNSRLTREERQMVLAGTQNDTEYDAVVAQLRAAWDDDPRDGKGKGKHFKGGRIHYAEGDEIWTDSVVAALQGEESDVALEWSYDQGADMWWCGVVDKAAADAWAVSEAWAATAWHGSEDYGWHGGDDGWSVIGSDVWASTSWEESTTEQEGTAPTEETPEIEDLRSAEALAAEANRTVAEARRAVADARQNRSGFYPGGAKGKGGSGKGKGKRTSSDGAGCLICGRSDHFWRDCPDRYSPKGRFKGKSKSKSKGKGKGKSYFAGWWFDLFDLTLLAAEMVLDCGATETAGGTEAVQEFIKGIFDSFSEAKCEIDAEDRPWFRFANGDWGQALSRAWIFTPLGWLGIYVLDAPNIPVLAGMSWLENHDLSFRRNELELRGEDGSSKTMPLRKTSSGHRVLNVAG